MLIHHWLTLGQPCGLADEPSPGCFSPWPHPLPVPLFYVRMSFSTFTLGFTMGFSSFHPSIIGQADPLGAVEPERAPITNPQT